MSEILDGLEAKFGLLPAGVLTVNSYMVAHLSFFFYLQEASPPKLILETKIFDYLSKLKQS